MLVENKRLCIRWRRVAWLCVFSFTREQAALCVWSEQSGLNGGVAYGMGGYGLYCVRWEQTALFHSSRASGSVFILGEEQEKQLTTF
jgi:hypothetical protein